MFDKFTYYYRLVIAWVFVIVGTVGLLFGSIATIAVLLAQFTPRGRELYPFVPCIAISLSSMVLSYVFRRGALDGIRFLRERNKTEKQPLLLMLVIAVVLFVAVSGSIIRWAIGKQ